MASRNDFPWPADGSNPFRVANWSGLLPTNPSERMTSPSGTSALPIALASVRKKERRVTVVQKGSAWEDVCVRVLPEEKLAFSNQLRKCTVVLPAQDHDFSLTDLESKAGTDPVSDWGSRRDQYKWDSMKRNGREGKRKNGSRREGKQMHVSEANVASESRKRVGVRFFFVGSGMERGKTVFVECRVG